MPHFSSASKARLKDVHPALVGVLQMAIKIYDFTVICGHRGQLEQDRAYKTGASQLPWPEGPHNGIPSKAADLAPYPIDWNDTNRFYILGGVIMACAYILDVPIRWGGDWDGDGDLKDETFRDLGHFELVEG